MKCFIVVSVLIIVTIITILLREVIALEYGELARAAVGRVAQLGDIYDARTDKFCGLSILNKPAPRSSIRTTDNHFTDIQFVQSDSFSNKFDKLEIKSELKVSILAGLLDLQGYAKHLRDEKKSEKAVQCTLLYNIQTIVEQLNVYSEELKKFFALDAFDNKCGTHVVIEVSWGANSLVSMEYSNTENNNKKKIEGELRAKLHKIASNINGTAEEVNIDLENETNKKFTFKVFGDVLPQGDIPQTFEEVLELMKKMPSLVQKSNDGKGKPLHYIMIPLYKLKNYLAINQRADRSLKQLDEQSIIRFVRVFEELSQMKQRLNDFYNDIQSHRFCIPKGDFNKVKTFKIELENREAKMRKKFAKILIKIRSGESFANELESLLAKYETEDFKEEKIIELIANHSHLIEKMTFADLVKEKGVAYIGLFSSFEKEQMKNPLGDIYILFFSEIDKRIDQQSWTSNRDHFLGLLGSAPSASLDEGSKKSTFIVVDLDVRPGIASRHGIKKGIRICHYKNGKYINFNLLEHKRNDSISLARSLEPMEFLTHKTNKRVDLQLRCPGSISGSCETKDHTWVCPKCNQTIEYDLDGHFYCACGRAPVESFEYKCSSEKHGSNYIQFEKDHLDQLLAEMRPKKEMNILILGETGVGKSTWINAISNYLSYSTLEEAAQNGVKFLLPSKFTITDENFYEHIIEVGEDDNEDFVIGQSATQEPRAYVFEWGSTLIRLIDTPGVGDTRGIEHDKKNFEAIMRYLSFFEELHGIVILLKPNNSRLSVMFRFCIKELLTHLHKSASENIIFIFTNARNTFYRPGDTMPPLRKILSEYKDANFTLSKHTIYCMDNEAFRFLCALKHNMKFDETDQKDYSMSWNKSVSETNRIFEHFTQIKPHKTKDTLSLNDVKQSLLTLTKPLAEISKIIEQNIRMINHKMEEIEFSEKSEEELVKNLYIPRLKIVHVPLGYPRTVCTDPKHTLSHKIENTTVIEYNTICHEHCNLKGVNPESFPNPHLKNCDAMGWTGNCKVCGCSWDKHMHLTYELKKEYEEVIDESLKILIEEKKSAREKLHEFIQTSKNQIQSLREEKKIIHSACAKFGFFLKTYAIAPYNDALKDYLLHLIQIEEESVASGRNRDTLDILENNLRAYEEEIEILEKSMTNELNYQIKPDDVMNDLQKLKNLPLMGKQIEQVLKGVLVSDSKFHEYHETFIPKPNPDNHKIKNKIIHDEL